MADEKEKELTIEEMKELISLHNVLPALLQKIEKIELRVDKLQSSFAEFARRYSDNVGQIEKYKEAVEELTKGQVDSKYLKNELAAIKEAVLKGNVAPVKGPVMQKVKKPEPAPTPVIKNVPEKKEAEPKKDKDEEKLLKTVDEVLNSANGRRKMPLTIITVKKRYRVSEEMAKKVLEFFEKKKMYNPKTRELTIK